DPVLVVWWSFIETPVEPYTYNNCHNNYRDPDYVCTPEMINGRLVHADDWQIAYGQQFGTAYEHLTAAYEAVYGNPNDRQKVQQVIQDVISNAGLSLTAPSTLTVDDIRNNAEHGESNRLWALLLSRDPAISVYLLSTALIFFNREEAFGSPGTYYQTNWQNFSNALNDVIEAWGNVGAVGSNGSGSGFGPTEPPIKLEVPDCPGVVREINAYNLPPSIYPKPNCGSGTPGNGTNGPTGVCTTDPSIQAYGTGEGAPPDGSIFWTFIGSTTGSLGQGFGPTDFAINDDGSANEIGNAHV